MEEMEEGQEEKLSKRMRVYTANTPIGPRNITFVLELREGKNGVVCNYCPYFHICNRLPHPECPDSKDKTFMDFCYNKTSDIENGPETGDFIPKEGTIEENLADIADPYKSFATDEHAYVKLSTVIDNICSEVCPDFDPSHCNCSIENKFCLLRQLFKNKPQPESEAVKEDKEDNGEQ